MANLNTIKAAASALHKAEAKTNTSNVERTTATKTLIVALAGFFAANVGASLDPILPIIHGAAWETYNDATKKSRKTNLATIAEIAKVKGRVGDVIAAAETTERDFQASFRTAAVYAKNNPGADRAAIAKAIKEKRTPAARTDGDEMETAIAALIALAKDHKHVYSLAGFKDAAVALQSIFNNERAANRMRFAREMAKPKAKAAPLNLADV